LKKSFIVVISVDALARFAKQSLLRSGFDVLGLLLDYDARSQRESTTIDVGPRVRRSLGRARVRLTARREQSQPSINQSNQSNQIKSINRNSQSSCFDSFRYATDGRARASVNERV